MVVLISSPIYCIKGPHQIMNMAQYYCFTSN